MIFDVPSDRLTAMFKARVIRKGNASSRLKAMHHAVASATDDEVKVGFPQGADGGILDRAFYNEFGTANIPERPFMREGIRGGKDKITRLMRADGARLLRGEKGFSLDKALKRLGVEGQGIIQDSITTGGFTPNAPATVREKGSSKPLIDTGQMRQAVSYQVGKRGKK